MLALLPRAGSAADAVSVLDLSFEELSQIEIKSDITSIKSKPLREQPGIVSVVSNAQIRETGARDLSDILMLVPGFALDTDVESMVGLTFRGLQGQEGKVLLVVDGIEINEPLYGSLPILNHIPADAIEQVEIIRGPGSAMYGGTAALAVVRVTTHGASQNGGYATTTPSYTDGRFSESVGAGLGYATNNWRFVVNASYTDTIISNKKYVGLDGKAVDLTHRSEINPLFLDMNTGWRDLDVRVIYDAYRYDDSVYYDAPLPSSHVPTSFESIFTSAKYDLHPADWLKITPQLTYRHAAPWKSESDEPEIGNFHIDTDRYQFDLISIAELTDNSGLMFGMRYQRDEAHAIDTGSIPASEFFRGRQSIFFNDFAGFAQYDLDTRWVNLSLGGRYESQNAVGGHFVPRVALTKAWQKFHLKALYSQAARIPTINVVNDAVGGELKAEETANYELEAGYRFTDTLSMVGNVFYMEVDKPILFSTSQNGAATDGYYNGSRLSTYGFEGELRWDRPVLSSYLGYSFYRANDNDIDYVRGGDGRFLAAPAHKISITETWHILKGLDWNVNGFWISERSAYVYPNMGIGQLDPEFILNTFLSYKYRHFTVGVGMANILDQDRYAPQPYKGGIAPLPLRGREVFAKITYTF